jgi:hypothetical protein
MLLAVGPGNLEEDIDAGMWGFTDILLQGFGR